MINLQTLDTGMKSYNLLATTCILSPSKVPCKKAVGSLDVPLMDDQLVYSAKSDQDPDDGDYFCKRVKCQRNLFLSVSSLWPPS